MDEKKNGCVNLSLIFEKRMKTEHQLCDNVQLCGLLTVEGDKYIIENNGRYYTH